MGTEQQTNVGHESVWHRQPSGSPERFHDGVSLEGSTGSHEDHLAQYEVLKPIGKGKFAIVYRAKRKVDNELVALKRITIDMMDQKTRDKCLKEVRLLQSLHHPNIIKYMDSFLDGPDLIIVVEWAAAGDLKRQLRKALEKNTRFEERLIWKYFAQISEAIRHMHERRVMHRDLKPANIFLTVNGSVKVGDLGLSRLMNEHSLEAHSKVGTPLYMSPEVLRGDGYDWKSDIWSLGCLLYELAQLRSPFKSEGLNLYSLCQKISQGAYPPLPELYSRDLQQLTYACLSIDPVDRPEIATVCRIASDMRSRNKRNPPARLHAATMPSQQRPPQSIPPPLQPIPNMSSPFLSKPTHPPSQQATITMTRWHQSHAHSSPTPPPTCSSPQTSPSSPTARPIIPDPRYQHLKPDRASLSHIKPLHTSVPIPPSEPTADSAHVCSDSPRGHDIPTSEISLSPRSLERTRPTYATSSLRPRDEQQQQTSYLAHSPLRHCQTTSLTSPTAHPDKAPTFPPTTLPPSQASQPPRPAPFSSDVKGKLTYTCSSAQPPDAEASPTNATTPVSTATRMPGFSPTAACLAELALTPRDGAIASVLAGQREREDVGFNLERHATSRMEGQREVGQRHSEPREFPVGEDGYARLSSETDTGRKRSIPSREKDAPIADAKQVNEVAQCPQDAEARRTRVGSPREERQFRSQTETKEGGTFGMKESSHDFAEPIKRVNDGDQADRAWTDRSTIAAEHGRERRLRNGLLREREYAPQISSSRDEAFIREPLGEVLNLMDGIWEGLRILDLPSLRTYKGHGLRLTKTHFAFPKGSHSTLAPSQFEEFVATARALFEASKLPAHLQVKSCEAEFMISATDEELRVTPPMELASFCLSVCQMCGYPASDGERTVTAAALATGCGWGVCHVLHWLCARALEARQRTVPAMRGTRGLVYRDDEEVPIEEERDEQTISRLAPVRSTTGSSIGQRRNSQKPDQDCYGLGADEEAHLSEATTQDQESQRIRRPPSPPQVDPTRWRQEVNRVRSRLPTPAKLKCHQSHESLLSTLHALLSAIENPASSLSQAPAISPLNAPGRGESASSFLSMRTDGSQAPAVSPLSVSQSQEVTVEAGAGPPTDLFLPSPCRTRPAFSAPAALSTPPRRPTLQVEEGRGGGKAEDLCSKLGKLAEGLLRQSEDVRRGERRLSSHRILQEVVLEHVREVQEEADLQLDIEHRHERLAAAKGEIPRLDMASEEVRIKLAEVNASLSSNQPLRYMKDALARLRKENAAMELKEAVLWSRLQQVRKAAADVERRGVIDHAYRPRTSRRRSIVWMDGAVEAIDPGGWVEAEWGMDLGTVDTPRRKKAPNPFATPVHGLPW